jgi:hypothetical protein
MMKIQGSIGLYRTKIYPTYSATILSEPFTPFGGHTEKLSTYDSKEVGSSQEKDV